MPHTTLSPTPTPAPALSLDERLALANTEMTARLDEAAVAYEVNTAHITTEPVDLADLVTLPLTPTLQPPTPHPTPVAALLQRAHHRLLTGGWCAGRFEDENGALCLFGAVRTEARFDLRLEMAAMDVLLDAIRRQFGDRFQSAVAFNDAHKGSDGRVPIRLLGQAADLAHARSI
ncbi:DUF6197 family protein [Streptomyces drozdowiczii]|uniref:DNA polymerase Y family protein n=1 Tax=Streptomyces drozdowiczii TaxID=202862 RepID=A0ABY6Q1X2_9ACTN|nr:hypothetical protein [Streptomyces drozdowiczii]MCX0247967.1 hypothetical protein [Streptomyces drozdowiczii]UZK58229.1 hypothetical protein NEH16_32845 [Streptomyces drozdowiczii]